MRKYIVIALIIILSSQCICVYAKDITGLQQESNEITLELNETNNRLQVVQDEISKNRANNLKEEIPLERIGKTEDIAKCVKWLIEDTFTTGQIISINGGWIIT